MEKPARKVRRKLRSGDSVSRYTVLEHLGTGGMGQVYAAYDPRLDRKIALKILRPFSGIASRDSRARLLREARALARLNDPNVLTLYDVGTFGEQIFLAMELVPGENLGHWLARRQRTYEEITNAFLQAGQGLVAAHEAGLVHRDFKLGNVMVRPDGRALVLDFGLARQESSDFEGVAATVGPPDELVDEANVELTRAGARLGTPLFMAPEQWLGRPAGPTADQFSYCVALYRALYGEPPFERPANRKEAPEWTVRPAPAGVSAAGILVPPRVRRILLRGLSTRPEDRYASMRHLLEDLVHDPWRRWRRLASLILLASVLGLAFWRPWDRPERLCAAGAEQLRDVWSPKERSRLELALTSTQRPYADTVARSMADRVDAYAGSWLEMYRDACESTHVRGEQSPELLDRRMSCLDQRRRELGALVRLVIADPEAAVEKAVAAAEQLPALTTCADTSALTAVIRPPSNPMERRAIDLLRDRLAEVEASLYAGRYGLAADRTEPLLLDAENLGYLPLVAEILVVRGRLLSLLGSADEASQTLERALQVAQVAHHDRAAADAFVRLVRVEGYERAEFERAERFGELAAAMVAGLGRGEDLEAVLADYRGVVALQQGRYEEAAELHRGALDLRRAQGRDTGPAMATSLIRLGNVLLEQGQLQAAEARYREALTLQEKSLGVGHPAVATTLDRLGVIAHRRGDLQTARARFERALVILQAVFGPDHLRLVSPSANLANVVSSEGDPEAALVLYDQLLGIHTAEHGADHPWVGITWINIGASKSQMEDFLGSVEAYEKALAIVEGAYGGDHPLVGQVLSGQGEALNELERFVEAESLHRRALDIQRRSYEGEHPLIGHTLTSLARSCLGQNRKSEAAAHLESALSLWSNSETDPAHIAWTRWMLAQAVADDDPERARTLADLARVSLEDAAGDHSESLSEIRNWLENEAAGR